MTDDPIVVRRLTHVDSTLASRLNPLLDDGTEWDMGQGGAFLRDPDNLLLAAFQGGEACGFLTAHRLQRFDERRAEVLLYEIGVHEDFCNRSVGKALIAATKQWATEVGADELWVLTNRSNEPAMALYRSAGGVEDSAFDITMFTCPL
jgi:ribosomal protein S18 acetylase RimI-like enzyme